MAPASMACLYGRVLVRLRSIIEVRVEVRRPREQTFDEDVYVEDVDEHFERARAGGARVVYPPEDTQWGTRRYRLLDPEGYEWSFGNYRPGTAAGGS
jgi:uncharacterized glyoxalase superfamily protein PhnB